MRSARFRKIRIQNTRLYPRAVFRDLCIYSKSHMSAGSAAQILNFLKSVPYLRAMSSPKFWTIKKLKMADLEPFLCQNGANSVRPAQYLTNHLPRLRVAERRTCISCRIQGHSHAAFM